MKATFNLPVLGLLITVLSCSDDNKDKVTTYTLDEKQSTIAWTGAGNEVEHSGSFDVTGGDITMKDGVLADGTFVIPISSIKNSDLPEEVKPQLLDHLKSPDFFDLVKFPEARFVITSVKPYSENDPNAIEDANYLIAGDFTLIGNTASISFPARIDARDEQISAEAKLKLDRTKWGMTYASDPALGEHHIFPDVDIYIKLVANN